MNPGHQEQEGEPLPKASFSHKSTHQDAQNNKEKLEEEGCRFSSQRVYS